MSFCETCIHNGNGRALSEAEALIHRDNFPNHAVVPVDKDESGFDEIEKEAEQDGQL